MQSGPGVNSGGGGSTSSRSRAVSGNSRSHQRQQTFNQEPRRSSRKPKAYRDQEPSPDHSSGSESGSESSGSQSASSSGSSSSSEEASREGSVHGAPPPPEPPQGLIRSSSLCLRNILARSGDNSVRDGLYHEFKKYGDVTRIYVNGQGSSRYAIIHFRRPEDAERGYEACRGKMFLGAEMDLQYYTQDDRFESNDHPPHHRSYAGVMMDNDFDPGCTRTLFVGNIEKATSISDLKEAFERYGEIVDVDIKKQAGNNPYAFIQFVELSSAIQARRRMDREFVGRNRVKVGFGKVSPINTIWVGVLGGLNEQQVERHFGRYGRVTKVVSNRGREQALVSFDSVESANIAQGEMKGRSMFGRRVRVEFVSRDSRQLFYDALQRSGPSDSNIRRYEPSPPRSRGRGGTAGYYENRWERSRGGRGHMRRDMPNHRPWHRGEYDYPEGSGYHQRVHTRYRGPYEGGGYDSDDYDQELRDYNYSRQREREKEQGRQRHERGGRDRDREDGNFSGNERYYPENQDRWRDDRSSSGSYEDQLDRKDIRPREFPDGHERERGGYSEDDERASGHSKPPGHDFEPDEKRSKPKERKKRKPRSPTPEGAVPEEKEALRAVEAPTEEKLVGVDKKKKIKIEDGEIIGKSKGGGDRDWHEPHIQGSGSKSEKELPSRESKDNVSAPASPPPLVEKSTKRKERKDKRRKHRRSRTSLGDEEEEREQEQETTGLEDAHPSQVVAETATVPATKQRPSIDESDSHKFDNRDSHSAPENDMYERVESEEKPPRRHSADEWLPKEERELSRNTASHSPRNKLHRDDRRRDVEKHEGTRPKRRRLSNGESPPPPPPPPPPPREAGEAVPSHLDVVQRGAQIAVDGTSAQIPRTSYEVAQAATHFEPQVYDANHVVPVGVSPASIPLNPASAAAPIIGTPPLTVHSPGVTIGVTSAAALASPPVMVPPPPPPHPDYNTPPSVPQQANPDTLLDLLRRYPVVWQGLLALKNDSAAVQMHYLAGNGRLAEVSLPQAPANGIGGSVPPPIRIAQRMRLEPSQLEGVIRRMQSNEDHCLLLALPCGRDPLDVHKQTRALKSGFINYLQQKQAAGIINVARPGSTQPSYVLHIFPPCDFAQEHLARVSPDLLDSAADSGHLMVVVASV
ncbi:msx2-interacting protein-like isoform X3 [Acropora millepora]|nr:msx2-interacting protein-like isoform X3 [Acropora millepora]XP_044167631.1 msx2-interacting protein-like isoform X3 [Acropora millepora]XP_044167632.1 msx2-interacting protein-like isoform X3 [Acropora millepora]XP_044167633.1 msx2-interacting protein-like isoform X3 [Acropora millepora]